MIEWNTGMSLTARKEMKKKLRYGCVGVLLAHDGIQILVELLLDIQVEENLEFLVAFSDVAGMEDPVLPCVPPEAP